MDPLASPRRQRLARVPRCALTALGCSITTGRDSPSIRFSVADANQANAVSGCDGASGFALPRR
jgi:hypothetical protein